MGKSKIIFEKNFPSAKFVTYDDEPDFKKKFVNQIHTKIVVNSSLASIETEADGIYQNNKNKDILAIRTADCLPIAVFGSTDIALLHAGWRGVQLNIMSTAEIENIAPTLFFLGPHIKSCCYEIQPEFKKSFQFSDNFISRDDKIYFDMAKECSDRIAKSFPKAEIQISNICTCCNSDFRSHRENKTLLRNWNILIPN